MQNTPRRAALYVRLSDDRNQTGDNVADQQAGGRALAEARGLDVARVYSDNDRPASAGSKPRPAFEEMLADAAAGAFDVLVIRTTDRLYRTPADQQRIADTFGPRGITIEQEWAGHPLDLSTPQGVLISGLMAQVSHYETQQKKQRQRAMNRATAATGAPVPGGPVPFGYNHDRLTPHPVRSELIRAAFEALLGGDSLASVIRSWNESGESAPRGGRWTYATVRSVLLRPLNAGLVQYDGQILPGVTGQWEPLVSVETLFALRALLDDPKRRTSTTGGRNVQNLLSGIARCGSCGSPMKPGAIKQSRGLQKGKRYALYRCMSTECTARVSIGRSALDEEVERRFLADRGQALDWTEVTTLTDNATALADVDARIQGVAAQMTEDNADVASLVERLTDLKTERARLAQDGPTRTVETKGTTGAHEWQMGDLRARRELLRRHLGTEGLRVMRAGKPNGQRVDLTRVRIDWAPMPEFVGPDGQPLAPSTAGPEVVAPIGPIIRGGLKG